MKIKRGTILMTAGTVLLLAALFLLLYNWNQDSRTEARTASVLEELKAQMPEAHYEKNDPYSITLETAEVPTEAYVPESGSETLIETALPEPDIFAEYEEEEPVQEVVYWIDSTSYLGVLYIPSIGIELPVISDWSYPNLRVAPCRYKGSVEEGDLVIAAHNYGCHFGHISSLSTGDEIIFTDGNGVMHTYSVVNSELIGGRNIPAMEEGSEEWDITLFTCNLSGTNRVTVRAVLSE